MQWGGGQFHHDVFHAPKVGPSTPRKWGAPLEFSPLLLPLDDLSPVNRTVVIADRAVTAMERIVRHLQGASLIGAERAKDGLLARMRALAGNAMPNDARKARFESIPGDIRSVLAQNHRIYYLIEEERVVILDVILDAPVHSREEE